jgi:MFS family permease
MAASRPRLAFLAAGAAALVASGVVAWWWPAVPAGGGEGRSAAPRVAANFLAFGSGWSQGFLEGCMVALLPIYLLSGGLSDGVVSWLMGGLVLGATLAQAPVAWLADRLGRAAVLAACNLVALLGVCCLLRAGGVVWLASWLFAVGACSGAFYPLGLALLGERTPPEAMSRAGSWFLAINCLGSVAGPVVAGAAMERFGRASLVVTCGGAVGLVLTSWLVLRVCRRALPAAPARPALKDAA